FYIVNGQKTWTTLAQHADWGFFLVRTNSDCKPQEGISFLLIDMKSPGVEVRPIITMDGAHEVNEVWLTDVKVPVANRVFEENKGWTCAKFLLAHERTGIAQVARSKMGLKKLKKLATETISEGLPLAKDRDFKHKLSELEIDLRALEITELRVLANEQKGKGPGAESSILKINGSVIQQRITELFLEAVGPYGAPNPRAYKAEGGNFAIGPQGAPMAALNYFNVRKTSIFGGSNEIQRNIIAKLVLGL
ncbi:MAG: acyl-CoA dehydrogenase-like protein, partial [Hyphomonadaceae bacterium]